MTLAVNIGIFSVLVTGLVLLTGVAGLTSFGQAAFMGVGAYTSAVLTTRFQLDPWLTLMSGLAVTSVVALLLGAITLRLKGHYLPLATIAWASACITSSAGRSSRAVSPGCAAFRPFTSSGWR